MRVLHGLLGCDMARKYYPLNDATMKDLVRDSFAMTDEILEEG